MMLPTRTLEALLVVAVACTLVPGTALASGSDDCEFPDELSPLGTESGDALSAPTWFEIRLAEGERFTATIHGEGPTNGYALSAYRSCDERVARSFDTPSASVLTFEAPEQRLYQVAVQPVGDAPGAWIMEYAADGDFVEGTRDEDASAELLAVSLAGNTQAPVAVSGTGNSEGATLAVSVFGDSHGFVAVSVAGDAEGTVAVDGRPG